MLIVWKFSFLILWVWKIKCLRKEIRPEVWWWGCHFSPTTCLTFSKSPSAPRRRFHPDHEVNEHVDRRARASDSEDPSESVLWHCLTLTLGKSLNLGQVQFPPLWKERIVVLWEAVVNFMNLSVSLTSLVKMYTVFPHPCTLTVQRH